QRRWPLLLIQMPRRLAPLFAPNDLGGLAEEVLAARVNRETLAEDLLEERSQRYVSRRPLLAAAFLLTDEDRIGVEVDVATLSTQQLAPPGPSVGGGAEERVDPRMGGVLLDAGQELFDFLLTEIQRIPQLGDFRFGQTAGSELPLDLLPRLEGRLLVAL